MASMFPSPPLAPENMFFRSSPYFFIITDVPLQRLGFQWGLLVVLRESWWGHPYPLLLRVGSSSSRSWTSRITTVFFVPFLGHLLLYRLRQSNSEESHFKILRKLCQNLHSRCFCLIQPLIFFPSTSKFIQTVMSSLKKLRIQHNYQELLEWTKSKALIRIFFRFS